MDILDVIQDSTVSANVEQLIEQEITYTLFKNGKFYIIEHVPARVNIKTGEQLFSPQTVEQLQNVVWEQRSPSRVIETPVYEFAA